ncbi:hypothetical protein BSKO_12796 [Bryopsis sp. KO-2023]|nr:hypothetical protein BSKO_12796 [Bryopsis sp. KO-2023]
MGNVCSTIETGSPKESNNPCGDVMIFADGIKPLDHHTTIIPLSSDSIIRVPQAPPPHLTISVKDSSALGDIQIEVPELIELNGCGSSKQSEPGRRGNESRPLPRIKIPEVEPAIWRRGIEEIENVAPLHEDEHQEFDSERPLQWKRGELIGAGAYGRVYLGLNENTGRLMAVKQVPMPNDESSKASKAKVAEHVQGLEAEVGVLKEFKHPNIVRYLGTELDGDNLNIFLEYVAGGSVASLLSKFGTFQENLIRVFTRQILTGLEFLHQNKIAHRDIKGGNILVDHVGVVKLADFGASKTIENLVTMNTGFKSLKGTPYWMAPEVIKQTGHGRQADIWSVGCTVIEMATGKPPWSEVSNNVTVMFHIASAKGPPPIPSSLSPEGEDFLRLCFDRNPKQRPNATRLLKHPFVADARLASPVHRQPVSAPSHPPAPPPFSKEREEQHQRPIAVAEVKIDMIEPSGDSVSDPDMEIDMSEHKPIVADNVGDSVGGAADDFEDTTLTESVSKHVELASCGSETASKDIEAFVDKVNENAIKDTLRLSQPFMHGTLDADCDTSDTEENVMEKQQQWADDLKMELEEMKQHCMALTTTAK